MALFNRLGVHLFAEHKQEDEAIKQTCMQIIGSINKIQKLQLAKKRQVKVPCIIRNHNHIEIAPPRRDEVVQRSNPKLNSFIERLKSYKNEHLKNYYMALKYMSPVPP